MEGPDRLGRPLPPSANSYRGGVILVAGGSGFIGRAVVRRLRSEGNDVAIMTAHPTRARAGIEWLDAALVHGDVLNQASLERAVTATSPAAVVQALTFPTFPVEKKSRDFTFEAFDHRGTERLVAAAAAGGAERFVFCSGAGAAPDAPKVWFRAKWLGEEAVRSSAIDHTIVRPSWVYGPDDRALNRFAAFARWLPFVPVIGDGRQRLQPVFVDDVAEVIARAALPGGPTGTFEVGGPDVLSMDEVLTTMLQVMGRKRRLIHIPAFLPRAAGWVLRYMPSPPLSPDAVDFVTGDALAEIGPLMAAFGPDLRLTPLGEGLATYL